MPATTTTTNLPRCSNSHRVSCMFALGQPGFAPLLDATSRLRKEQEEESKLQERMYEQRMALQAAERRYADVNRRLAETRAATKEDLTAEAVLDAARREAAEGRQLLQKVLPANIDARRETLARLHRMLSEPAKVSCDFFFWGGARCALQVRRRRLCNDASHCTAHYALSLHVLHASHAVAPFDSPSKTCTRSSRRWRRWRRTWAG
jgi:hypothetical protein